MPDTITEALLEMHYHRALVDMFATIFGASLLRFLKPSPAAETWVGFDQGWVRSVISENELITELRREIHDDKVSNKFYVGYFLQFKKVQKMKKLAHKYKDICKAPPYRINLSLEPNKQTGLSQHETLLKLSQKMFAHVYYACPMVFDSVDVYKEADLEKLALVDISSAPSGWATGSRHHVVFRTSDDEVPVWCSQPFSGKAIPASDWVYRQIESNRRMIMSTRGIRRFIEQTNEIIAYGNESSLMDLFGNDRIASSTRFLPESMTIIEFERK